MRRIAGAALLLSLGPLAACGGEEPTAAATCEPATCTNELHLGAPAPDADRIRIELWDRVLETGCPGSATIGGLTITCAPDAIEIAQPPGGPDEEKFRESGTLNLLVETHDASRGSRLSALTTTGSRQVAPAGPGCEPVCWIRGG